MKTITPAALILETSDEAGPVCVVLDRPVRLTASATDGMRRSIARSVPMLFGAGNQGIT